MDLKKIRELKRISQKELGEKLGFASTTISSYERGVCDPNINILIKMADIFNVSVDTLVGHDSNLIDMNSLDDNQKLIVNEVINVLPAEDNAKIVGYIASLKNK